MCKNTEMASSICFLLQADFSFLATCKQLAKTKSFTKRYRAMKQAKARASKEAKAKKAYTSRLLLLLPLTSVLFSFKSALCLMRYSM